MARSELPARAYRSRALVCPEDPDPPEASDVAEPDDRSVKVGLERLLAAVEELPLRYAPFYERLAALWDVSEEDVQTTLERAKHAGAFRLTGLHGVRRMSVLGGPRLRGVALDLLRLAPGARFPRHRHEGHEVVLVLEGSYRDSGRDFEPGDTQAMPPGSTHALQVSERSPCVAAVASRGFAFTSLPLRLVQLVAKSRG